MQLIRLLLVVAVPMGCGSDKSSAAPETPFVSAAGTKTGSPVTATIGTAGGSVQTADGRIAVTIPAGALTTESQVALTPITNTLDGAVGSGYRLELGSPTLAQPITVTFGYDGLPLTSGLGALRPAVQLADGRWQAAGKITVDEGKKTLSFRTRLLTQESTTSSALTMAAKANLVRDLAMFEWFFIAPSAATVKTSEQLALTLEMRVPQKAPAADADEELAPLAVIKTTSVQNESNLGRFTWTASDGTVQAGSTGATFTAPAKVPAKNPVAVSARYSGQVFNGMLLVSNVRIVGGAPTFKGKVTFSYSAADQDVSGTADLRFERFEDLADVARYALLGGTFDFKVTPKPGKGISCTPKDLTGVAAAEGESNGVIVLWKAGSSQGQKYTWSAASREREVSFDCRDDKGASIPWTVMQIVSLTTPEMTYSDVKVLEGTSQPLTVPAGSGNATWRFDGP